MNYFEVCMQKTKTKNKIYKKKTTYIYDIHTYYTDYYYSYNYYCIEGKI